MELIWKPIPFEIQVDTDCSLCLAVNDATRIYMMCDLVCKLTAGLRLEKNFNLLGGEGTKHAHSTKHARN